MGNLDRSLHVFLLLLLLLSVASIVPIASARKPINVTYDQRALIINGQRRMLISAGIHYPRATPEVDTLFRLCSWFSCINRWSVLQFKFIRIINRWTFSNLWDLAEFFNSCSDIVFTSAFIFLMKRSLQSEINGFGIFANLHDWTFLNRCGQAWYRSRRREVQT